MGKEHPTRPHRDNSNPGTTGGNIGAFVEDPETYSRVAHVTQVAHVKGVAHVTLTQLITSKVNPMKMRGFSADTPSTLTHVTHVTLC